MVGPTPHSAHTLSKCPSYTLLSVHMTQSGLNLDLKVHQHYELHRAPAYCQQRVTTCMMLGWVPPADASHGDYMN